MKQQYKNITDNDDITMTQYAASRSLLHSAQILDLMSHNSVDEAMR